ncbi:MAG: TetR/AcrR family transcriptional regulator [Halanaerobiales bacterium]|nr:TetR/AcrR family transcriptional regulator [Halanaerobiales bacterium]
MIDFDKDDVKVKRIIKVFVNSTIELMEKDGIENITVRKVAEISGYNPATIYNYFDNSRQLIFFASINFMKDYFKEIEQIIDNSNDPLDNYIKLWETFCRFSFENPKIYYSIFGENIEERPTVLINKYFKLFPEDFKYTSSVYLPLLTDNDEKENSVTQPLTNCVDNGYFTLEEAKKIDEVNMLYYHGMLSLIVNNRLSYTVEEAIDKTMEHIRQVINNFNEQPKRDLKEKDY